MPGPLFLKKYSTTSEVTAGQLAVLVAGNALETGQVYNVTGTSVVALATSMNTYKDIASLSSGGGGSAAWGGITGTLTDQTDLNSALNAKQDWNNNLVGLSDITGTNVLAYRVGFSDWDTVTIGSGLTFTSGTLSASGGSGSTGGTATINFGAAPGTNLASVVVTGQAGILAGSRIKAWFMADTSADHNSYEHANLLPLSVALSVGSVVPGTGFTINAATLLRLTGAITVRWEWS